MDTAISTGDLGPSERGDPGPDHAFPDPQAIAWPWIPIGMVQGAVLLFGLVPVWEMNQRLDVVGVFGAFAFLLTGILLGYRSAQGTVIEASIGGVGLALIVAAALGPLGHPLPPGVLLLGVLAGFFLTAAGGGMGNALQAAVRARDAGDRSISWIWVTVGTVIGVVLNGSAGLIVNALFDLSGVGMALCFAASFLVTGVFVGYHAPGHTVKDSAVVAVSVVVFDAALLFWGFGVVFPFTGVLGAGVAGAFLILLGGWIGDVGYRLGHGELSAGD